MYPTIDKKKTGRNLRNLARLRNLSAADLQEALHLGCVQSVYHWFSGISLPTVDNLYVLSDLLGVPVDLLLVGDRSAKKYSRAYAAYLRLLGYAYYLNGIPVTS